MDEAREDRIMTYPDDVMKAAREAFETMQDDEPFGHVVARAILAERERCAKVADAASAEARRLRSGVKRTGG